MNEMRYDWLADRWVIFAPNRSQRPDDFCRESSAVFGASVHRESQCPFCKGAEDQTPEPTLVLPENDFDSTTTSRRSVAERTPRLPWLVRVVPNKFPAVTDHTAAIESNADYADLALSERNLPSHVPQETFAQAATCTSHQVRTRLFRRRSLTGAHEVIIESPDHIASITQLDCEQVGLVFEAYRRRLAYWRSRVDLRFAVVFKNYGADAGASLAHSHSQLIGTDFVPSDVQRTARRMSQYFQQHSRCFVCDVLDQELEQQERVIVATNHFVAICPFASRFPYSFSILPRKHRNQFDECSPEEIQDLAKLTRGTLSALESAQPHAAYNYVLQTGTFGPESVPHYHWRLKIIPRLSKVAGFEWSSDCFINTVRPEDAAADLRRRLPVELRSEHCE